jgi:hypothetical protein
MHLLIVSLHGDIFIEYSLYIFVKFHQFPHMSAISCRQVLVVEEAGVPERTTDHGQATGKR